METSVLISEKVLFENGFRDIHYSNSAKPFYTKRFDLEDGKCIIHLTPKGSGYRVAINLNSDIVGDLLHATKMNEVVSLLIACNLRNVAKKLKY